MKEGPSTCLCFRARKPRYRHAQFSLSISTDFPVLSFTETFTSSTGKSIVYLEIKLKGGNFDQKIASIRLIILRIRFRASDFGLVAKINIIRAKSKQASCAEMVLGSFSLLVRKFKPTSTSATSGAAPSASFGPGLGHPSLRSDSSLVAKRRAEALHVVFFSTKHPSPARELLLLCVCSRMIYSHERRALGALLSLFFRSEPASTDS